MSLAPDPGAVGEHPIPAALSRIEAALDEVADTNPAYLTPEAKGAALTRLARAESRLTELRLRVLADADDLAATTGARDAAAWYAHATHTRPEDARADHRLARALDRRHPHLAHALAGGQVNPAQARVIHIALTRITDHVDPEVLTRAETTLIGLAADFGPTHLARLGRHILHTIAPDLADAIEARHLADLEANATRRTRLTLRRQGDGTTRLSARLPDHTATRLARYLNAYTNPRTTPTDTGSAGVTDPSGEAGGAIPHPDPVGETTYPRRLGQAFCQLLETLDPHRLPLHGGDATTLIVTLSLDQLRTDLATAELLDDTTDNPHLTAEQTRRLACTANIIPAVLNTTGEVLDLGRAQRLFTKPQRKALLLRDRTCRAQGCDIPGPWCEAHHTTPWHTGGPTNLNNGTLLCSHHHHRAHDPHYHHHTHPNGTITFHRRQ